MDEKEKQLYIEKIKTKYQGKEKSILDNIRELDRKATLPAEIKAYITGIIGALIFGVGMCFSMKVIGDSVLIGVLSGLAGIFITVVNYPLYKRNLEKGKKKYEEEILSLLDEV